MRKMKRQICIEETVSRIPSLFAYYDYNELGEMVVHKATDSSDGSYGKIVSGLKIPYNLRLNGETVISANETVSYRTLMNYYYSAKRNGLKAVQSNNLIIFVEEGIGKIEIKLRSILDEHNMKRYYYETPDGDKIYFDEEPTRIERFLYISQAKKMYDEMVKKKILCHEYWKELETSDIKETFETKEVCCICDDYNERGGDGMVQILSYWLSKAEEIAGLYFEYVDTDKDIFSFNVSLVNTYNDPGYYTPYVINWKPGKYLAPKEKFIYEDSNGVMQMYQNGDEHYYGRYDTENECPVFNENDVTKIDGYWDGVEDIEINEKTDSKLSSLKRFSTFTDIYGEPQKPEINEDWLYFYCKDFALNIRTKNDELGNIGFYGDMPAIEDNKVINLMAYGDMITDIKANEEERTITFEYVIGAHLKGVKAADEWIKYDDDNNAHYHYDKFEVDYDSEYGMNCGIFYTETYYYNEGSDLENLIADTDKWNEYIVNDNDTRRFDTNCYEFYTGNSVISYEKQIGFNRATINYLTTDLTYVKDNSRDVFDTFIFKEDYLMGIHFKPYVEDNVDIDRGKNAAFERHIKLGEVKTLQDLENYQNGGFFNIKEF